MARHEARMGQNRNAYRILEGKPEGMELVGSLIWKDNINMDLKTNLG
jgi:hypothetical protein